MVFRIPGSHSKNSWEIPEGITRPSREADLAFMSIPELASLIRSGEISCLALTEFYLNRLKKYDPQLHCVVTLTEDYAIEQARKMDAELAAGKGPGNPAWHSLWSQGPLLLPGLSHHLGSRGV